MYSNPSFQKPRVIKNFHMRNIFKTLDFSKCSWLASDFFDAASYDEHLRKAAFLYNFANFITSLSAANSEFISDVNYCVLKNRQVQSSSSLLITSDQNPTVKRNFSLLFRLHQIATDYLLFLDTSNLTTKPNLLKMTAGVPVPSMSDQKGLLENAGMVKLAREKSRMRVRLTVNILNEYAFPVSSQLVRLASIYPLDYFSEASG